MKNAVSVLLVIVFWHTLAWGLSGSVRAAAVVGALLSIATVAVGLYELDGEG